MITTEMILAEQIRQIAIVATITLGMTLGIYAIATVIAIKSIGAELKKIRNKGNEKKYV